VGIVLNIVLPGRDGDGIEPAIEQSDKPETRLPLDAPDFEEVIADESAK
jgi:hypothetical protein